MKNFTIYFYKLENLEMQKIMQKAYKIMQKLKIMQT